MQIVRIALIFLGLTSSCAFGYKMTPTLQLHKEYMTLSDAITQHQDLSGVEEFLQRNDGTLYADKLRAKYLHVLAKLDDSNHFLANYKPSNNLSLECYYYTAQIKSGENKLAFAQAKEIWQTEAEVPNNCNKLFKSWIDANPPSEDAIFERFYIALDAHQWSQLAILRQYMNDQQRAVSDYWVSVFKNPRVLSADKLPNKPYARLIVLTAMERELAHNVKKAENSWNYWGKRFNFTNEEVNNFIGDIVLHHAKNDSDQTERWVKELRPGKINHEVLEWRVRAALLQNNWGLVQRAIMAMPADLRNQPCWSYWLARSYDAQGQQTKAHALLQTVATHPEYYGFMAQRFLGQPIRVTSHKRPPSLNKIAFPFDNEMEFIHELKLQHKTGEANLLNDYLETQATQDQRLMMASYYYSWQMYSQAIHVIKNSVYKDLLEFEYPLGYAGIVNEYAKKRAIPPALVYAVMRQESLFQSEANSGAGALGLMQLMPRTAMMTAKQERLHINSHDLVKPKINVSLGTAYLHQLLNQFHHPVLACAAYNAGGRAVNRWKERRKPIDMVIWIETLPWNETRGYLKKVVQNYLIYQYRLGREAA